jgi:Flp pilus assembly protein TadD
MSVSDLEQLLQIGEYDEAALIAQARLTVDANDTEARVALARLALGNEDVETAEKHLKQLKPGEGGYTRSLAQATLFAAQGEFEKSEKLLRELCESEPTRAEAFVGLAAVAGETENAELKLKALKKAALNAPEDWSIHYELGMAFAESDDAERAAESLTRAYELNPAQPGPVVALAQGLIEIEDLEAAHALLQEYCDSVGENPHVLALLVQVLVGQGEIDEATNLAVLNADENPQQPALQTEAARLLLAVGEPTEIQSAISRCDALIATKTATALTYLVRAQAAEMLEPVDAAAALQAYQQGLSCGDQREDLALYTNFGLFLLHHGTVNDAAFYFEAALELETNEETQFNLALAYSQLDKKTEAIALLESALEESSEAFAPEIERLLNAVKMS